MPVTPTGSPALTRGIFGKTPSQGDFLRLNVASPAAQALVGWLHQAIEVVHRAGAALPAEPVRFLFRARGSAEALLGVFIASRDRVGRAFPLSAFAETPAAPLAAAFPALPAAIDRFALACEALLAGADRREAAELGTALRALPAPDEPGEAAARLAAEARRQPAAELVAAGFADLARGAVAYAFSTLERAARQVRGREPERTGISLDCPARSPLHKWFWLELLRRNLSWSVPPIVLWTGDRVIASLGAPNASVLRHLCDPSRPGEDVWPLRTHVAAAIAAAQSELSAGVRGALERESADALLEALIRRGGARG